MTTATNQSGTSSNEEIPGTDTTTTPAPPAPAPSPAPADEPELTPREKAMLEIEQANHDRIDADHVKEGRGPVVNAPPPPPPAPAPSATDPEDDQLDAQLTADEPTILSENLDKTLVRVKIDGREQMVPVSDLVRDTQLDGAARRRFEEADRLLKQVKALQAESSTATPAPPVGGDGKGGGANTPHSSKPNREALKGVMELLADGEIEKATDAMAGILEQVGGTSTAAPSAEELAAAVTPAVRQQLERETALGQFATAFPEIVADTALAGIADGFLDAALEDTTKSYADALKEAGENTRKWLTSKTGKEPAAAPPTMSVKEKLEAKAKAAENLAAPGLNTKAIVPEEPEQSRSDVIQEMRKQRGLD